MFPERGEGEELQQQLIAKISCWFPLEISREIIYIFPVKYLKMFLAQTVPKLWFVTPTKDGVEERRDREM
jgi:hypothetical protein